MDMALLAATDNEMYGSHNCHINALNVVMNYHELDLTPLYKFNFNVNIGENDHHFGGNVPYKNIIEFLKSNYMLHVDEIDFSDISEHEMVVLPIDSYDLPYIENRNEINVGEQLHYVLAVASTNNTIHIYDPYYKKSHMFDRDVMMNSWEIFKQPIIRIEKPEIYDSTIVYDKKITPYIYSTDYTAKYEFFADRVKNILRFLDDENKVTSELFKRYFSCFKSMMIIRKKHFEHCGIINGISKDISNGWGNILKEMCKFSLNPMTDKTRLFDILDQTIGYEIEYLEKNYG